MQLVSTGRVEWEYCLRLTFAKHEAVDNRCNTGHGLAYVNDKSGPFPSGETKDLNDE